MPTEGKVKTLFVDKERTEAIFPRTKLKAVSNDDGVGLDAIISSTPHFSNSDNTGASIPLANAETLAGRPASEYATKDYVTTKTADFATESFVTNKIAEAQVSGGSGTGSIDLSGYTTKDEFNNFKGTTLENISKRAPAGLTGCSTTLTAPSTLHDVEIFIYNTCVGGRFSYGDVIYAYVNTEEGIDGNGSSIGFEVAGRSFFGKSFLLTIRFGQDAHDGPMITATLEGIGFDFCTKLCTNLLNLGPDGYGPGNPYEWLEVANSVKPEEFSAYDEDTLKEIAYSLWRGLPLGGSTSVRVDCSGPVNIAGGAFGYNSMLTVHRMMDDIGDEYIKVTLEGPPTYYGPGPFIGSFEFNPVINSVSCCCYVPTQDEAGVFPNDCEWEWKNPPMAPGYEYRTAERWNGYPVYTQLVNFGTLPNNTIKKMPVYYGADSTNGMIRSTDIINITSHVYGDTYDKEWTSFPFVYNGNTLAGDMYYRDDSIKHGITVRTQRDLSKYRVMFTIRYTKGHGII